MKKRMLAAILAFLMLFGMSASPALVGAEEAVWNRGSSEYFDGGDVRFGTVELHSGSAYATVHFAYGYGLKTTDEGMQTIAGLLAENRFPAINLPFDNEKTGSQSFFVLTADNTDSLNRLISELEQKNAAVSDADAPVPGVVSSGDVSGSDAGEEVIIHLSAEQAATLLDLFGKFGSDEGEVSASDAVSSSDVISGSDAVSETDAVSESDAVSDADVSSADAEEEKPLTNAEVSVLMGLLGAFGEGSDEDTASDSDVVSGADAVSESDAAVSDADAEQPDEQPAEVTDDDEAVTGDEAPVEEEDEDEPVATPEEPETVDLSGSLDTLNAVRDGSNEFTAQSSLQQSLEEAFPGFFFGQSEPVAMFPSVRESVTMSLDGTQASIDIEAKSEYVDIELNGTVFSVLMLGSKSTRYTVERVRIIGSTDGVPAATVTTTAPTTTTTTSAIEITTTTTTAPTTAATTTTSTTAATTTTTTTTTTTAPTTTTTAPTTAYVPGQAVSGYVSTRTLELRVRKGPGLNYSVITCIPKGTPVTVLDMSNEEWYRVRLSDGTEGYCYSYYITLNSRS